MPEGPTPPIFHSLVSGLGVGGKANFSVFRYQHANPQRKFWRRGVLPNASPRRQNFALQWNIGLRVKGPTGDGDISVLYRLHYMDWF